jgi:hypothetical protein
MVNKKKRTREKDSTRNLIGLKEITDFSLRTYEHGELVFFNLKPTNISVLSVASVRARIYALMTVLKGMTEIEMCCLNSAENFEDNKSYLKGRISAEQNYIVRQLLEKELQFLDQIQVEMATAREFMIIIRLVNHNEKEVFPYLNRIEKTLREQGFSVNRAGRDGIKRILRYISNKI